MTTPIGYYYYFRDSIDGLIEAPARSAAKRSTTTSQDHRQSLGMMLVCATVCLPVIATGVVAFALKLLN